ncbi:hypothetical protein [Salibacterium aidingense]|uniref:hypothetical protein n=1 Tax=Salibacterium aidingense TaxID=384933 RepID=UPI0004273DE8|nr:hypothetical protein [Salibacterium aidingense]
MTSNHKDQAESLRRRFQNKKDIKEEGEASSLPPRTETHKYRRSKTKWNIRFPTARLLLLLFLAIVLTAVLAPVVSNQW